MENKKLKPCPFCGGHNIEITSCDFECCADCDGCDNKTYAIVCNVNKGGCGGASGFQTTKAEAIEAWNRRANDGT